MKKLFYISVHAVYTLFLSCFFLIAFNLFSIGIRRLIEGLPLLKDKIHNKQVLKALTSIIENTKKKPDAKAACLELEEKINDLLKAEEHENDGPISDSEAMPPPPVPPLNRTKKTRQKSNVEHDDSTDSEDEVPSRCSKEYFIRFIAFFACTWLF